MRKVFDCNDKTTIFEPMKIHEGISMTEVAVRYYEARGENFDRERSRKQFHQHLTINTTIKIDKKLLRKVIDEIYKEQIEMLNG